MKIRSTSIVIAAGLFAFVLIVAGALVVLPHVARANQADDTTITFHGYTAGVTPFISNVHLTASNPAVLKSIQFTIHPKPGSVTRTLSGTYANYYLVDRGFENSQTGEINLPVYGLYAGYNNNVTLTYRFMDGSSRQANFRVTTASFDDLGCGYNNPTSFGPRRTNSQLSYDYIFDSSSCSSFTPVILDSDGVLRWVSTLPTMSALFAASTFFDNAIYRTEGSRLFRIELDDG